MNHKKKYDLNVSFDNKYFQWLKRIEKKYPVRLYISLIAIGLFFTMYTVRVIVTSRLGFLSEPTSDYSWFFNILLLCIFLLYYYYLCLTRRNNTGFRWYKFK